MSEGITISYEAIISILIAIILAGVGWIIHYVSKVNERHDKLKHWLNKIDKNLTMVRIDFENKIENIKDKISDMRLKSAEGRKLLGELE